MRFVHPELASWLLALPLAVAWWTFRRYARASFRREATLSERTIAASRLSTAAGDAAALALALLTFLLLVGAASLIGFSNAAIAISHFTRNVDSLFFYLDWLGEDTRPNFGTDIGSALLTASDMIDRDAQPSSKVVLVISDGEDEGEVLASAVNELRNKGVAIYSIGVGGSRPVDVPVPADDGVGEAGWALKVTFNEATLRSVAASGGGRYYRSQTGHELLAAMEDLAARERRQIGWSSRTEYRDLYPYALAAAAVTACALLITL
jgi:hypothetical protein